MALTIDNATIGYNGDNVETALNNLKTKCIEDTIEKMKGSMEKLNGWVSDAWVGASAEQFKENMEADRKEVEDNLKATYEELENKIHDIVKSMATIDEELVERREY